MYRVARKRATQPIPDAADDGQVLDTGAPANTLLVPLDTGAINSKREILSRLELLLRKAVWPPRRIGKASPRPVTSSASREPDF